MRQKKKKRTFQTEETAKVLRCGWRGVMEDEATHHVRDCRRQRFPSGITSHR